jgi:hypothetical protein
MDADDEDEDAIYQQHQLQRTKKFQCQFCKQTFGAPGVLTRHTRSCSAVKNGLKKKHLLSANRGSFKRPRQNSDSDQLPRKKWYGQDADLDVDHYPSASASGSTSVSAVHLARKASSLNLTQLSFHLYHLDCTHRAGVK